MVLCSSPTLPGLKIAFEKYAFNLQESHISHDPIQVHNTKQIQRL